MPIRVKVLYFGQAREAAGGGEEVVSLPENSSVGALVSRAAAAHAKLAQMRGSMQVAVNEELASEGDALKDGDVVAFLPPVAGG